MSIEVTHEDCGHEWDYTGSRDPGEMVTCPRCYNKVRIPEEAEA